jgi:hypothetical protein
MPGVGFHSVPHFARGRGSQVNGIVIHQFAGGTVAAVQNWLRDSRSRVSYHFGVGRNGEIRQWVDTNDTAWATGPVNGRTIAIGHEATDQPLTDAQLNATASIIRWARGAHRGIPAGRNGLTGHRNHMSTNCPGNPIMGQLDELQRRSTGTTAPPPPPPAPGGAPPFPGRILMQPPIMRGEDVRTWQAQAARRWTIGVDGAYGPQSEGVCRQVQAAAGLPQDGRVGPNTWPATWRVTGATEQVEEEAMASIAWWPPAGEGAGRETHRAWRRNDGRIMYSRNGGASTVVDPNGWARGGVDINVSPAGMIVISYVNRGGRVCEYRSPPGFQPWQWADIAGPA